MVVKRKFSDDHTESPSIHATSFDEPSKKMKTAMVAEAFSSERFDAALIDDEMMTPLPLTPSSEEDEDRILCEFSNFIHCSNERNDHYQHQQHHHQHQQPPLALVTIDRYPMDDDSIVLIDDDDMSFSPNEPISPDIFGDDRIPNNDDTRKCTTQGRNNSRNITETGEVSGSASFGSAGSAFRPLLHDKQRPGGCAGGPASTVVSFDSIHDTKKPAPTRAISSHPVNTSGNRVLSTTR